MKFTHYEHLTDERKRTAVRSDLLTCACDEGGQRQAQLDVLWLREGGWQVRLHAAAHAGDFDWSEETEIVAEGDGEAAEAIAALQKAWHAVLAANKKWLVQEDGEDIASDEAAQVIIERLDALLTRARLARGEDAPADVMSLESAAIASGQTVGSMLLGLAE